MAIPNSRATFKAHCLENKYSRWYWRIIDGASDRSYQVGKHERHHVIPRSITKSLGLEESQTTNLTFREHFVCHLLLPKFLKDSQHRHRMFFAVQRLLHGNDKTCCKSSRLYELLREPIARACRERNKEWFENATEEMIKSRSEKIISSRKLTGYCHSEETKKKIGIGNKGKLAGKSHHYFGKKRDKETCLKISHTRITNGIGKGEKNPNYGKIGSAAGKKWANNGIIEKYFPIEEIPIGWVLGRIKWGKK